MGNRSRGGKQKQGRALIGMPVRDNESQNRIQELLEAARKDLERKMNHETTTPFRCHDAEACALGQKCCPTPWACGCEEDLTQAVDAAWNAMQDLFKLKKAETEEEKKDAEAYYAFMSNNYEKAFKSSDKRLRRMIAKFPEIFAGVKDELLNPTCCEVNKVENCNQGRACPVRNGTHKPSEALINIEEPNGKAD